MKRSNLKDVKFSRVSLVDKGASFDPSTGDGAHVLLYKRATPAHEDTMADKTITVEEITKAISGFTAEQKESLQKALGAANAPEDILKGASPEVRELLQKQAEELKKANDRAEANAAAVADLQKRNRLADIRKRVDVFSSLSGDAEVLSKILACCEDNMGAEVAKKFEETLAGWNTQLEKGLLRDPIGSRGTTETADPGSALEEATKRAAAIVTKSEGKTDHAAALVEVFKADPDLYARYSIEAQRPGTAKK